MSEETNANIEEEIVIEDPGQALDMAQETMETFIETADVSRVYGEPIVHEETMIIPAAEVVALAGFGAGYGSGGPEDSRWRGRRCRRRWQDFLSPGCSGDRRQ